MIVDGNSPHGSPGCGLDRKNVASAMCQEVADHGLASSISAFNLSYSDAGLFGVIMTAPDNKLDDLLWYVIATRNWRARSSL